MIACVYDIWIEAGFPPLTYELQPFRRDRYLAELERTMNEERMTDKADLIARDLMTAGIEGNDLADSLKLYTSKGLYLGSWSLRGLADRIRKHLNNEIEIAGASDERPT